ncbi:hypothetical protein GUITHDRAFT_103994 [Guillardia theta CCMP2712]|uniref:Uncharacterized protein n=1 Tax=Guillardia theta (strain CCMP2712) TaxID=905079 RepID=L1JQ25_GUITC|nr:hypothetical protein GUITHDRAFT_103994 [Guillardia theta CCMP2712]EKX50183.1 hypothetical protein GUITHDRAFT_103994 [Guillardia theta CCMP2712]|eukprot:XP_005837163.1 hypothetical protein GUITHDRAFT_103994 [Guillardia theta CCMP2712]
MAHVEDFDVASNPAAAARHQRQDAGIGWEGDLASVLAGANRKTHSVRKGCERRAELEGWAVKEALHIAKDKRTMGGMSARKQGGSDGASSSASSPCEGQACQNLVSYRNSRAFREREEHIESRIREIEQELMAASREIENQDVQQGIRAPGESSGCAGRRQKVTVDEWGGHLESILLPPRQKLEAREGQGDSGRSRHASSSYSRTRPSAQELGFEGDLASCLKPRGGSRDLKTKLEAQRISEGPAAPGPRTAGSRRMPSAEELGFPTGGLVAVMRPAQRATRQTSSALPHQEDEASLVHALPPHLPAAVRGDTSGPRRGAAARRLNVEQWPRRAAMMPEEGQSNHVDTQGQLSYEFLLSLDARIEQPGLPGHLLDSFKTVSVSKACDETCAICLDLLKLSFTTLLEIPFKILMSKQVGNKVKIFVALEPLFVHLQLDCC